MKKPSRIAIVSRSLNFPEHALEAFSTNHLVPAFLVTFVFLLANLPFGADLLQNANRINPIFFNENQV
ncbi:MAG: hypothetical protein ACHQET_06730 [Chitinophagales bacterium]